MALVGTRLWGTIAAALLSVLGGTMIVFAPVLSPAAAADAFTTTLRPALEKYCFECHGLKSTKADVDLLSFKTESDLARNPDLWLNALAQVRSQSMPPAKAPQPSEEERRHLVEWLDAAMDRLDERAPANPGRVPPHRLNRAEYNNTIRDLIGLDLRPADEFPVDDTAHGFDNVAGTLTLSPLLLEKYLDAAVKVCDRAVLTEADQAIQPVEHKIEAEDLPKAQPRDGAAELRLEQELGTPLRIEQTDEYEVRVRAWQHGAGEDPATVVLKVDGIDTKVWSLSREDKPAELRALVTLAKGSRRLSIRHTWHMELPKDRKAPDARLFLDFLAVSGPTRAIAHGRIFFIQPDQDHSERDAAREVLRRFASRAFRRPVQDAETARHLELYDQGRKAGKSHVEAARLSLIAMLVSPQFLFRLERDLSVKGERGAVRLSDFELAGRLSYFLWSSMPDEQLFRLAGEKRLSEPGVLRGEVRRMLADPKCAALSENFAGQWLHVRKLDSLQPDPELFRSFTPNLREAMKAEALAFFSTIVREDRSVLEFLNADWALLNEDLAKHYGIRNVVGGHLRRVSLTNSVRGGVTTMAAVLAVTSHPTRTSAVKRGKWILEEILGAPPPPPPPNVPELEVPKKGSSVATSLRERLERHRSDPNCFGCHVRMDALGLGLENFDAIGRWRDKDGGRPIDASGTLPDGRQFAGPAELKRVLGQEKEAFTRTLVEKMLVYALGRNLERSDRREVKRILDALAPDFRFSTLVTEIVSSYPFRYRIPDKDQPTPPDLTP